MLRLQTDHLSLEPLTRDDYPWLCELYGDIEVMRYISGAGRSHEESRKRLDRHVAQGEALGFGHWLVRAGEGGERLGSAALMVREPGLPVEIGFALAPAAWGRGVATEAARCLLAHALGTLRLPLVHAFADARHLASGRVLLKAGMRDAGLCTGPYGGTDRKYELTREQWLDDFNTRAVP